MRSTGTRTLTDETVGTVAIGDRTVRRMGFGAMRISGARNVEGVRDRAVARDLLISTKAGFRPGKLAPGQASLPALGRPEHIREECDKSLARLGVERLELYIVHVPDPEVPWTDTVGAFAELQADGIAFLPHSPLRSTEGPVGAALAEIAAARGVLVQQVALAWLFLRSPVMLPIPGTSQMRHADENIDAAWIELAAEEMTRLDSGRP